MRYSASVPETLLPSRRILHTSLAAAAEVFKRRSLWWASCLAQVLKSTGLFAPSPPQTKDGHDAS